MKSSPLSLGNIGRESANVKSARWLRWLGLVVLLLGGWVGCRCRPSPPTQPTAKSDEKPSLRLVLISSVAGAAEPCGCVKDMLGGVDHAAAYLHSQGSTPLLVLGAGPVLFMDPVLATERGDQDLWKAEALLKSLRRMGLAAWTPGANDYAAGSSELARLTEGGPLALAANLEGQSATSPSTLLTVGGVPIGVTGVSQPKVMGKLPPGVTASDPLERARSEARTLVGKGAKLRILLLAMPRGDALRIVESIPEYQIALIGKGADKGEANDPPQAPMVVGKTLVIEAQNHLQSLSVVDLFIKNDRFEFENGDAGAEARDDLQARVSELERRIHAAEADPKVRPDDLAARRRDLERLKGELARASAAHSAPSGSYYKVERVEVRERLGKDAAVAGELSEYYKRVNAHNREAFKDKKPPPVAAGASEYLGVEQCSVCHQEEYAFWKKTRHAGAYATLSRQFKEFNLDCVGCHVTGYEQAGGSTVTHVEKLMDVQCEVCHGPGSRHAASPQMTGLIATPERNLCASKCHHPPHVKDDWSADRAFERIVGPGHGG
jgi:2',3'-cyclic-nucleotide 2'-phosphodiesterase (5'-nucleotidase family)